MGHIGVKGVPIDVGPGSVRGNAGDDDCLVRLGLDERKRCDVLRKAERIMFGKAGSSTRSRTPIMWSRTDRIIETWCHDVSVLKEQCASKPKPVEITSTND